MDTAKSFDAYEMIGIVTPGTVAALLLTLEWPELRALVGADGLTVGDLGLFVLVAFVLGHLVQGLGNLLEMLFWAPKGMPTAWVREQRQSLVTVSQREALQRQVTAMEGEGVDLSKLNRKVWRVIAMRMYARVQNAGRSARVDACNRNYGLFRGLGAAFVGAALWYAFKDIHNAAPIALSGALAAAALFRMYRVSVHYARNLVLEFIDL